VLRCERFDLTQLARSCVEELAAQAAATHVSLAVDSPREAVHIHADPDRIRQVLVNLLDNAIRYSPPGETVRVSISPSPDSVTVSVQDNGPGIPAEDQARVFERFYRGDKSRVRKGDVGAGLGLSIAQTLVEAHDGHIELASSPGRGTTIRFSLPVE
jgi:signal transduction histidine kinase